MAPSWSQRGEFRKLRALAFVGANDDNAVALSESAYDVFGTQACQGGLALLLATLCFKNGLGGSEAPALAQALTLALNASLITPTASGQRRMLALSKDVDRPVNRMTDMNATRAVEFRYTWLEILCTTEGREALSVNAPAVDLGGAP